MNAPSTTLGFSRAATMVTTPRTAAEFLFPPSPASVVLLRGDQAVRAVTLEVAARALMAKHDLLWVEGGNRFELAALAETAHRWMVDPRLLLRRLRLARAFTIYQLEALCTQRLADALRRQPEAVTILSEPLALCLDAEVARHDARTVVRHVAAGLRRLCHLGHRLLIACPDPPETFRGEDLGRVLEQVATRTIFFRNAEDGVWLHEPAPPCG